MLKRVVVKGGHVISDHALEQDLTGYYDDTYDIFAFDDTNTPLYNVTKNTGDIDFNAQLQNLGVAVSGSEAIIQNYPASDPRLRISLEECRSITVNLIKEYCNTLILSEYPMYKQLNIIARNGYTDADKETMTKYIMKIREASNEIEEIFNSYTVPDVDKKENMVLFDYRTYIKKALES